MGTIPHCYDPAVTAPPESREPGRIREMFGTVARRYDLLNRLLSLGRDASWRRAAARAACPAPGLRILDLCGGTGDLSVAVARAPERPSLVVCCDFSHPMLERAGPKLVRAGVADRCPVVEGDALALPFADASFDAVTVGFGVRNLADMTAGFREMRRVLAPGGRLVILEFSRPDGPVLKRLYRAYLAGIVPRLGRVASDRGSAYLYLARTIADFPEPDLLAGMIRESGFAAVGWEPLSGGIVCVHTAFR